MSKIPLILKIDSKNYILFNSNKENQKIFSNIKTYSTLSISIEDKNGFEFIAELNKEDKIIKESIKKL